MCILSCSLCFREYWKRRADSLKNSDREGLLRSRGEEEEVVSDEGETADSSILMTNMQVLFSVCVCVCVCVGGGGGWGS